MIGFKCKVTGSKSTVPIAKPVAPVRCGGSVACTTCAKQPIFWCNRPSSLLAASLTERRGLYESEGRALVRGRRGLSVRRRVAAALVQRYAQFSRGEPLIATAAYGFSDGAQNDIFDGCDTNNPPPASPPPPVSSPGPDDSVPPPQPSPGPEDGTTIISQAPPACTSPTGVRGSFFRLKHDAL